MITYNKKYIIKNKLSNNTGEDDAKKKPSHISRTNR